ncbi:MAG: DNAase [Ferrovum sp. 37-45-19]|uniref:TatD family hydrolase n=1 Tax=Ferrovum sp. JA12 TaxID=1356299 RepID=UPI000703B3DB|nr:TatD family hydrolase [Ferrovum sp. JA12]OYV80346.1 MAG: DNAase [Ferrovum sp. 21-44-67]OYV95090.1 MAG: DNAase [Ferrovum sp. 37-45-19]OZB31816.1 MAG: DNAase [Ferrovum sp. 34-44-207]HQT80846.1 TatD family hydrolase [Ferrovaceae bacterium]KRH78687.1 putative deoxyribonuclease YcfH [Ferrovum sp. JA12]
MYIDSHCHLNFPELNNRIDHIKEAMLLAKVSKALCISVNLETFQEVIAVAMLHDDWYATVGVHPDYQEVEEPTVAGLVTLAQHKKVIGIGETGLDYFRLEGDLEWQRERFRVHIRAARECQKPLIIHTRHAPEDTLKIMKQEYAAQVGGILHCFTESLEVAEQAIEMGFYISISGIVTFKNAQNLKDTVIALPMERLLIETDSPYLAPAPYRGKTNEPAYVVEVAKEIARLKGISLESVAEQTSQNFLTLFNLK